VKRPAQVNIGIDRDEAAIDSFRLQLHRRKWRASCRHAVACRTSAGVAMLPSDASPKVTLLERDAIEFLRGYAWKGDELCYLDPPYLMETRASKRRIYRHEMTTRDHERLLEIIIALPCMVIISGYASPLYARALAGWNVHSFNAVTRGGRVAREHVWFNYPLPFELHDYRYLGATFRERERIKRKKARWRTKLAGLPPLERHAILSAIEEMRCSITHR
jgi:hypothetical protein